MEKQYFGATIEPSLESDCSNPCEGSVLLRLGTVLLRLNADRKVAESLAKAGREIGLVKLPTCLVPEKRCLGIDATSATASGSTCRPKLPITS